jgi:glutathione S-transferase
MPLTVHIFSGAWDIPSESPFCLKLLTWMKMAEIPFEASALTGPPKSKSGKAPYVERDDGTILEDSSTIIDTLTEEFSVGLDATRTPTERASMLMLQRTVETHLYFAVLLHRWRDHWPEVRASYFKGMMPAPVLWAVGPFIRRDTLRQAKGQGMGRMPWPKAVAEAEADLEALSTMLGSQDYFMGTPGMADAIVYGALENVRSEPFDGPLKDALLRHGNLVSWLDRVRSRCW